MQTFAEILAEKLNQEEKPASRATPGPAFSGFSDLAFELPRLNLKFSSTGLKSYRNTTYRQKAEGSNSEPQWKPIGLSAPVTEAFLFFHSLGEVRLTDLASALALKKAFRRLAKALHPDRFATAGDLIQKEKAAQFVDLRRHYEVLVEFLESRTQAA